MKFVPESDMCPVPSPVRDPRRIVAAMLGGLLAGSVLGLAPSGVAQAKPSPGLRPQVEQLDRDGGEVHGRPSAQHRQRATPVPAPVWPKPGTARVALPPAAAGRAADGPVRAGDLPVWVSRGAGGQRLSAVDVRLLDRAGAPEGWRNGLVLKLSAPTPTPTPAGAGAAPAGTALTQAGTATAPAREGVTGTATVSVDYRAFRYAFGGDWASRLRLWQLPECAVSTPGRDGCQGQVLASQNDTVAGTVTAQAPVASAGTFLALAAGAAGSSGNFAATSLSPSATWAQGGSSGGFSWKYPLRMPPGVGDLEPSLELAYSSSSVDGRSEATNNQPSWIGEGFEYWPGFIERRYVPCSEDMAGSANNDTKTGDQCWRSDNATMSLNGSGAELVFEEGKGWHARNEDGAKVEKLTGADNGDNDGEYWKVTTTDGIQYFFGLHKLPGQTDTTDSTNTARVYGNHDGEPCHATAFSGSHCDQAWRWNLDYAVDPYGNTVSYWYERETNKYGANLSDSSAVSYVRDSVLKRIDYGTWFRSSTDKSVTPTAQVVFDSANRCVTSSCGTHDKKNWPDTPWDQECTGTTCAGKYEPTFWSTKRLAKITTRVWDTTKTTPAWQDVESWTLNHTFPPTGDGSDHPGLWLDSITHAGYVGGTVTLPPVTFEPVSMANRVLTDHDATNNWQRIGNIVTETGAKIQVSYSLPDCTDTDLPADEHTNTRLCYPVRTPDPNSLSGALVTKWWHKYVVRQVSESDMQLADGHQSPPKTTRYFYGGTPAWHYADDDGLSKPKYKTWDQYRGYRTVSVRVGDTAGKQTLTTTTYLRGMHGDRAAPSGGTRSVTVPASVGSETVYDDDQFAGMVREEVVYNGSDTKPVSKTVNVPWMSPPTASRTINGDLVTARFTNTKVTYKATALGVDGDRGWRTTRTESTFSDAYGTAEQVRDDGDTAVTGDEKCVTNTYNRNTGKNLVTTLKRVKTTALECGKVPGTTAHMVSDERYYYDGATSVDTAPKYGSITQTDKMKDWKSDTGTVWQTYSKSTFDAYGRTATATDVRGNTTRTDYTPATGGPITAITTTSPDPYKWKTVTTVAPYWADTTTNTTDPNGRVTDREYDPLGRLAKAWKLGWRKADHPTSGSVEYSYVYSPTRSDYPYIKTRTLHAGGGYLTSYEIFDGLLRSRQTQSMAVGGGRVVTDTVYDETGRAVANYGKHAEPGDASGTLWWEPEWSLRTVNKTSYDNAGRVTMETVLAGDGETNLVPKWHTFTEYEGDLTRVTPPTGGTPTTTLTDALGHKVEVRQHTTAQGVDGPYQATRYAYNRKDQLTKVTDTAGNEWTYTFDVKGRQIQTTDPDKGTTGSAYNDYDDLTNTTDAEGRVLAYEYDALGRKIGLYDGTVSAATKRASWKYDKTFAMVSVRGQLTEATRYDPPGSANAYTRRIASFQYDYQPAAVHYVIPDTPENTGLAGTYGYGYSYSPYDGTPSGILYEGAWDLVNETVTTKFDKTSGLPTGLDTTVIGETTYVAGQQYTAYGEPTLTTRKIAGGVYTQDDTEYDTVTRRVTRTRVKPETATGSVSDRRYDYDAVGNILSIREAPQVGQADNQCFRYDALRRLTSAWTPTGTDCAADPTVATLGGPAPYWTDWSFDTIGNRTRQVTHTAAGNTTQTVTVPDSGPGAVRPHSASQVTTAAPGQSPVTRAYGYDATGNTTSRPGPAGNSQALTWDAEGKAATAVEGTAKVSNVYDAEGERLIRRDPAGTTLYLPGVELRRQDGATTGTRYYSFAGKTAAQRTKAGGLVWVYSDHQGTQQIMVHALTQKVTIRRQTPYGEPRGENPAWPNGKGFVGGDIDPTGLTHVGAREYDATLGRFISVDPVMDLTDPQQWNAYTYANSNPTTHSDPSGKCIPEYCNHQAQQDLMTDAHTGEWKPEYTSNFPATPRYKGSGGYSFNFPAYPKRNNGHNSGYKPKGNRCGPFSWLCSAGDKTGKWLGNAASAAGEGLKVAGQWVVDNRGMLVSLGATAVCFVPAVGWAACAGLQAVAFGVRTQQAISENGGWEANKNQIIVDGVLTAGTLQMGAALRMAQYGKLGGVKNVPLIPLPKFISPTNKAAYDAVSTAGWVQMGNMKIPWSFGPTIASTVAWGGPSYFINRCYVQENC